MAENQRLKEVISYLKKEKVIYNQQDFVDKIGSHSSVVSEYITGKRILSEKYARKICEVFPNISAEWLLTSEGEMLKSKHEEKVQIVNSGRGVPYYDIDISATLAESFSDIVEQPDFFVDFKPFNDCNVYLPVFGESMYPTIMSGEIVALKKVDNPAYIQYGEAHLVITNAESNNMRTIKVIRKHQNEEMIILKPENPNFDELVIPRSTILSLYIVKGKITRKQL